MELVINGKCAAIKKGTSFEYVLENRAFTNSDGYSLSITLPLRGCPENIAIFGNIHRQDVAEKGMTLPCEILNRGLRMNGVLTVVEVTESEVKAQFLEGRSADNFSGTLEDVYINELDLGEWPNLTTQTATPLQSWMGIKYGMEEVALPWVNDYSGNLQNAVTFNTKQKDYVWDTTANPLKSLSWQTYLIVIASRICDVVGYSYDFRDWENSPQRYLLVCNTLPAAWEVRNFAYALPRWTVAEFFEKLEDFMGAEFEFNHLDHHVTFSFASDVVDKAGCVEVKEVLDTFTTEVDMENEDSKYRYACNVAYAECDHRQWPVYSCDWFIKRYRESNFPNTGFTFLEEFNTLSQLLSAMSQYSVCRSWQKGGRPNRLLYARDTDGYYVLRSYKSVYTNRRIGNSRIYDYYCCIQPVNMFGPLNVDDKAQTLELELVPAWLDETDETLGTCLFLSFDEYSETAIDLSDIGTDDWRQNLQPSPMQILKNGKPSERKAYYDKIFLGYWDGTIRNYGKLPFPIIEKDIILHDFTSIHTDYSLRLQEQPAATGYHIDTSHKYHFSFLSNELPDVRSVFLISGKRYVAEKITATFTETGMSQLFKGVFWRITNP